MSHTLSAPNLAADTLSAPSAAAPDLATTSTLTDAIARSQVPGVPKYATLRLFTDDEERTIGQEYRAGGTYASLAERYGCAAATIRNVIRRNGVESRPNRGEHSGRAKLTAERVVEIRQRYADGQRQVDLAAAYGVNQKVISTVVNHKAWRHVDGPKAPVRRSTSWRQSGGYRAVHAPWHPLAQADGSVPEHRFVLYRKLGPGQHPCHWCGRLLTWRLSLHTDHLDDVKDPQRREQPRATCAVCNSARATGVLLRRLRKRSDWRQIRERLEALEHMRYVTTHARVPEPRQPDRYHTMTPSKVREVRRRWAAGETQTALAAEFGISVPNIHFIVCRKTWALVAMTSTRTRPRSGTTTFPPVSLFSHFFADTSRRPKRRPKLTSLVTRRASR
jgi:Mor family transcriptional regulator